MNGLDMLCRQFKVVANLTGGVMAPTVWGDKPGFGEYYIGWACLDT